MELFYLKFGLLNIEIAVLDIVHGENARARTNSPMPDKSSSAPINPESTMAERQDQCGILALLRQWPLLWKRFSTAVKIAMPTSPMCLWHCATFRLRQCEVSLLS